MSLDQRAALLGKRVAGLTELLKAWSDEAREAAAEARRGHPRNFAEAMRNLQDSSRPAARRRRPRHFSMNRLQGAVAELREALGKIRKAWTDEAREAALEARRARSRLPQYLESRGYLHTGMAYDDPHAGDWSRSQAYFQHRDAPHKQVVFHSSGDWEVHDIRRQRGRMHPEMAVARGRGVPKLQSAIRQHH